MLHLERTPFVSLVTLSLLTAVAAASDSEPKPPKRNEQKDTPKTRTRRLVVPTYTNQDLDRVAPFRGQTGALSSPAVPLDPDPHNPPEKRVAARTEAYWRHQADRVRERVRTLKRQADALRRQLELAKQREANRPLSRPGTQPSGRSITELEARLRAVEEEINQRQAELEERARRAGALPGWLR